jgi:hypothetical protein
MSPNWSAPANMGGDPNWNDPRWGSDPIVHLDAGFDVNAGGYLAVLDRAEGTLAMTFRVLLGSSEAPDPADHVYIGVASNAMGDNAIARAVTIRLVKMQQGTGPTSITTFELADYISAWASTPEPALSFVNDVAVWRGAEAEMLSWSVSVRIDLTAAGVDTTRSFRMALRIHIDGRGDLLTPGDRPILSDVPTDWAVVSFAGLPCVSRVSLYGRAPATAP